MVLKILKGTVEDKQTDKIFYVRFWFNGKSDMHWIGKYSQSFGTKECDEYLVDLVKTHQDPKTKFWIKDPNETKKNEKVVEFFISNNKLNIRIFYIFFSEIILIIFHSVNSI